MTAFLAELAAVLSEIGYTRLLIQVEAAHLTREMQERKKTEEEHEKLNNLLIQAQKMESVGRLAGGIAHDFNNMLTVISGHTEIALQRVDSKLPVYASLQEIRRAVMRSIELTGQLLTFARKQPAVPSILDVNDSITGMLNMLKRLAGEDIEIGWMPTPDLWTVRMDSTQLVQIMMNLAANARDAIESAGKLVISTQNVVLDNSFSARHRGAVPGEHVLITIQDNGCGMDMQTLEHLFEPFYTTKESGHGVGLGLATVYGIIRQNSGFIEVDSGPGKGTTFRLYIPRSTGAASPARTLDAAGLPKSPGETVLLVEDEPMTLDVGRDMLRQLGYKVLTASSAAEALRLAAAHAGTIHVLISDVVMPEIDGWELVKRIRAARPAVKCLLMSGYTDKSVAANGELQDSVCFLQKPFSLQYLASKLSETLAQKQTSSEKHQ